MWFLLYVKLSSTKLFKILKQLFSVEMIQNNPSHLYIFPDEKNLREKPVTCGQTRSCW